MGPDLVIYWTLSNFLKPLAAIILPKSPTFLGNFCEDVKIYHFSIEIICWATFIDIWRFFLVTLVIILPLGVNLIVGGIDHGVVFAH